MFTVESFSQGQLLSQVADPSAKGGVCVALCDLWLQSIKANSAASPSARMAALAGRVNDAVAHQKLYAQQRAQIGRFPARAEAGRRMGLDYEEQTTIMRVSVGMSGIFAKLSPDLKRIGAGATWSLRFSNGDGHALSGFSGLTSFTNTMHRQQLYVFDPNIGQYTGAIRDLNDILKDIFKRVPLYNTVVEVSRVSEN